MMPYLVDTNIFLELMLEQKEKNTVKQLLNRLDVSKLFISDFSFHSSSSRERKDKTKQSNAVVGGQNSFKRMKPIIRV